MMTRSRFTPALLAANAVLMAGVLLVLIGGRGSILPAANAQVVAPIAGGAGLFLMPAQISRDRWGCYVMDVDTQNLLLYAYDPGEAKGLRLLSARNFTSDRQLQDYNTLPPPREIEQLVNDARNRVNAEPEEDRPVAP